MLCSRCFSFYLFFLFVKFFIVASQPLLYQYTFPNLLDLASGGLALAMVDLRCIRRHYNMARTRSHLHLVGPCPSNASFSVQSSCPHLSEDSSSLGTNVTIPYQNFKYSRWHRFHYSQVNWWSSFTCQRNSMAYVTGYCHIDTHRIRVPKQVRAGRPDNEGNMRGTGPSRMKLWSSPGPTT